MVRFVFDTGAISISRTNIELSRFDRFISAYELQGPVRIDTSVGNHRLDGGLLDDKLARIRHESKSILFEWRSVADRCRLHAGFTAVFLCVPKPKASEFARTIWIGCVEPAADPRSSSGFYHFDTGRDPFCCFLSRHTATLVRSGF